ncbi:MAG: DUF922 domain-containing protein [Bacteroidota bacterium]
MRTLLFSVLALSVAALTLVGVRSSLPGEPGDGFLDPVEAPGGATEAKPVYSIIDIESYEVTGTTQGEVLASLRELGPKSGQRDFFGMTETEMSYRYWKTPGDDGCRLEQIRLDLHVVITLPTWEPPRGTPYELKRDWARFETALRRHEDGHREIAEWGAREVYHALRSLRTPTCDTIDDAGREIAQRLRETSELRQAAFDRQTGHGRTQGAVWPPSFAR